MAIPWQAYRKNGHHYGLQNSKKQPFRDLGPSQNSDFSFPPFCCVARTERKSSANFFNTG